MGELFEKMKICVKFMLLTIFEALDVESNVCYFIRCILREEQLLKD